MNLAKTILAAFLLSPSSHLSAQSRAPELPDLASFKTALQDSAPPATPAGKAAGALSAGAVPTQTNYDRAKALYEAGVKPASKDLLGFNYGRCFKASGAIDELTVFAQRKELAGPIDPDYPQVVATVSRMDWSVKKDEPRYQTWYKVEFSGASFPPAVSKADHLETELGSMGYALGLIYEVRKNGDYLVLRFQGCEQYCYTYFKDWSCPEGR